jgi:YHYH protein
MRIRRSARMSLIVLGAAGTTAIIAQPQSGRDGRPPQPPPEALAACANKADGAQCSVNLPSGGNLAGQCHAPPGRKLACIPAGGPPGGPPPGGSPQGHQGAALPSTGANTQAVLCALRLQGSNASAGLPYAATWNCANGMRNLISNGVPDHVMGAFPNPGNPNRISVQTVRFSTTLSPMAHSGTGAFVRIAGYALNGVKFDPGTAQSCDTECADRGEGHSNPWRIEALGQRLFAFGVDANNAHVQPDGAYHYHGVPEAMLTPAARSGQAMALIGWAVDGYPIYARFGHAEPGSAASALRAMRSSYRLKAQPDSGRPPVSFAPMGTFTQDYEFVRGLGDLDECNGRTDVTPEFPMGIYHYYATDSFPYVQRCVKGTAARVDDGPPPFARLFGMRP